MCDINKDILIRRATGDDISQMVALLEQLFSIEADFNFDAEKHVKGFELLLECADAHVLIAQSGCDVVGLVTMQTLVSTAQGSRVGLIEDMVIDEKYRGFKIGRLLLKEMQSVAVKNGLSRLQLLADVDNHDAIGFYKKTGWSKTNLICMRKLL